MLCDCGDGIQARRGGRAALRRVLSCQHAHHLPVGEIAHFNRHTLQSSRARGFYAVMPEG
jgi:hypothetical protein